MATKKYILDLKNLEYVINKNYKIIGIHVLVELTEDRYLKLKKVIDINEDRVLTPTLLNLGGNYQSVISMKQKSALQGFDGKGVTVGHIDTGNNNYWDHYTGTTDEHYNFTGDGVNSDNSSNRHGTQTSSIIKSPQIGWANGCKMVSVKVLSSTTGITESILLQAIAQMVASDVDIFSMSFQTGWSSALAAALLNAHDLGCIPTASSGNSFTDGFTVFPANSAGVVAVNALEKTNVARFRSWQKGSGDHGVDISCGGADVDVVYFGQVYPGGGGTSFSSPFFCGTFACEKERLQKDLIGVIPKTENIKIKNQMLAKALKHSDPAVRRVLTF